MKKLGLVLSGLALVAIACGASSRRDGGAMRGGAGKAGAGTGGGGTGGGGTSGGGTSGGGTGGGAGEGGAGHGGQGGELPIAGESGTGGTGVPCSSDPGAIGGLSFNVQLQYGAADELRLATVFHFEQVGGELEVVIGSEGQAFRGKVTPAGSHLDVEPGLRIRDNSSPYGVAIDNGITVNALSLCFHPARDSEPYLDGKGEVHVVNNGDDYFDESDATIDFAGAPWDSLAPTLPASQTLDPLDPDDVRVSEPLKLGAVAGLDDVAQSSLSAIEQADTVVAFRPATVLPLGLEANVGTDARDLSGNKLVPHCVLRTDDDPGVQALDGFESELHVVNLGRYSATLVSGAQALEGARALEVPAGGIALLHLVRPNRDARHVRFELMPEPRLVQVPASYFLRAGVVGGSEIVTQEIPVPQPLPSGGEGGAAGAGGAGSGSLDATAVDLELSEAGDDILLEITAPFIELSASTDAAAIVDGLRIE